MTNKYSDFKKRISNKIDKYNKKITSIKAANYKDKYKSLRDNILNKYKISEKINSLNEVNLKGLLERIQDSIEQNVRKDSEEISLRQSTYWAKGITWLIIGGSAFGMAWLGLAKTEEIVIAPGELEPIGGVINIQMPINGVTKNVLIEEGQRVSKGQVLITLDNEISEAKMNATRENLEISETILSKLKDLVEQGAVSKLQVLQQENRVISLRSQNIENNVTLKYQTMKSPINGSVFDLKPTGKGYVARTSEPVLKIVPNNKLYAKIEIPSRNIGFVTVGKPVDISIESYPASDFGVIEGTIKKISSDALPPDQSLGKGYRFPADVELKEQSLKLVNGKKLPLQVGMNLTANIKLRKVSYLQILFNTFNEKSESLRSL